MVSPSPLRDELLALPFAQRARRRVTLTRDAFDAAPRQYAHGGYDFDIFNTLDIASPKDSTRHALGITFEARKGGALIFRDRVQFWDGAPVMRPDLTQMAPRTTRLGEIMAPTLVEDAVGATREVLSLVVRTVTDDGAAPHIKAQPGTVSIFFSGTNDGDIESTDASYATAQAGGGSITAFTAADLFVGQLQQPPPDPYLMTSYLSFNTSALPDGALINWAKLALFLTTEQSAQEFTSEARTFDWGATLTTADWQPGTTMATLTRLATFFSGGAVNNTYCEFSEDGGNLRAAINTTGTTFMLVGSNRFVAETPPGTNNEYFGFESSDTAGSSQDPMLIVAHGIYEQPDYRRHPNHVIAEANTPVGAPRP